MGSSQQGKPVRVMAKLLLLGSFGVGKTSLIYRFIEKKFRHSVKPTIGADFLVKQVDFERPDGGQAAVICQIWDLAGHLHKMAKRLAQKFYFGTEGVFFCYDITRPLTLEDIRSWKLGLEEVVNYDRIVPLLIANKNDLVDERQVNADAGQSMAAEIGAISYLETSAKTGDGVEKAFHDMAFHLWKKKMEIP